MIFIREDIDPDISSGRYGKRRDGGLQEDNGKNWIF